LAWLADTATDGISGMTVAAKWAANVALNADGARLV